VALGETMRQRLIEGKGSDPAKTLVIPDWADCTEIVPGPKRNPFSIANGLVEKFVVMHSGNIGLSQSLETLVHAAARLSEYPDIEVVFVGEGVKKPGLIDLARALSLNNVRFLPYQPIEKLRESFAAADVFVVSLKVGMAGYIVPSKLYGILAAGRPYIAAVEDASEVTGITTKYDCGLLASPGDPGDLAEKVLALYRDRERTRQLGVNARDAMRRSSSTVRGRSTNIMSFLASWRAEVASGPAPGPPLLKRPFDVVLAGVGLVISAPLWALIAAAIKLDDGGAVFYPQERAGSSAR
jgi:glycosyltransferase involved in cell wall biosynthesis